MRFALDSSHQDFASSIDALLSKSDMPAVIRSWNTGDTGPGLKVWQRLAETGVNGLLIADEHDGLGADAVDLVVAVEQLGRHAVPGPVAETVAVVPALLAQVAPDRLSALASGSLATVARRAARAVRASTPTRSIWSCSSTGDGERRRARCGAELGRPVATAVPADRRPMRSATRTSRPRSTSARSPPPHSCRASGRPCSTSPPTTPSSASSSAR